MSLLLAACSANDEAERYARLVEEWHGRTVELPAVMVDVVTGDTIDPGEVDFTLVTYIDSTGCTGCRMRLPLWTEFLRSLDSIAGDQEVLPIIVVNVKDDKELSYLIRRDAYGYPVVSDKADSLNLLNGFPEEPVLRSLLLNRDKQVIAIGNPTTNHAIADLYRSIISGSKTFSQSGRQVITAKPSRVEIGEIAIGREVTREFSLDNCGQDTVYIRDIITSCPCTEATVADSVIAPGASVQVNVKLREDSIVGDIQRTVHIYYRDFNNPTILGLSGRVI
ncbi:MAG: DUF1573 domain-containing protein [Duncaniella sp.]|nr:DUF1573 domain-containing protein [Duncaniella sp.]